MLHQYADDCQVYLATPVSEASSAVDRLTGCLTDVNAWLGASRLSLNPGKTQVMWLGSKHLVGDIAITEVPVMTSSVAMVDSARDLGVVINKCLTMSGFVSTTCRAGFFQLRQLRPVVRSLTVMQLRQSYMLLSRAVLTTVTVYCTALPTHCSCVCNPCRMLPPAWLRAHVDETTSPRC